MSAVERRCKLSRRQGGLQAGTARVKFLSRIPFVVRRKRAGVLFVCANNICRSPLAAGVFRAAAAREGVLQALTVASAGTSAAYAGQRPDARAVRAAYARGYDLGRDRARRVSARDFERFDWILAMDSANLGAVTALRPAAYAGHVGLMLEQDPLARVREVPDPYYGGIEAFERVLDLIEPACGLLAARLARELHERAD